MASYFQAASLVATPSYPNSVAWSDENLVAVASGHLVTILNPSLLIGPRGLITLPPSKPFPIGVINREDLLTGCLLPTCLSRDVRPCVRSISWSHLGLAPNSGCLLAVCTTEGRVKLYRSPYCEFKAEWIEVKDISDLLFDYLLRINFEEVDVPSTQKNREEAVEKDIESRCCSDLQNTMSSKKRRQKCSSGAGALGDQLLCDVNKEDENGGCTNTDKLVTTCIEVASFPCLAFKKGSSVEVLQQNGTERVWVGGVIKRVDGAKRKALVQFSEKVGFGKKDEWVDLNTEYDSLKHSSVLNGSTADKDTPPPNVRPFIDVGNLPEQIFLVESHEVEGILCTGQKVEAWTKNRWVEGLFMGFSDHNLSVELSGDNGCVVLNPMSVRLAPVWNSELKSWQATLVKIEPREGKLPEIAEMQSEKSIQKNLRQCSSVLRSQRKERPLKRTRESDTLPLLTAAQYASRSSMLSSVIVAWSPALYLSSEVDPNPQNRPSSNCGLLAVGGKSGKIYFWRINEPRCYTVEKSTDSVDVILAGLLQAHSSWITAISWGLSADASKSQVLLVTGSSDGSVKIWLGDTEVMLNSLEVSSASFSLLKEVNTVAPGPVSVLSLTAPVESPNEMFLAIGRGSGLLEFWIYNIPSCKLQFAGLYDAHGQAVTGLAWAFDGRCLYSCSQDNSICCWVLHESALQEVAVPSKSLGLLRSNDLPHVSDSCFGLAISPGNLVVAVARGFDETQLNPMYQARTQKATVEFSWIGGQHLEVSSDIIEGFEIEPFPGLSKWEMMCWESNLVWSLKKYDNTHKPLVLWDIITAMSALKQYAPNFVKSILVKWFTSWFQDYSVGVSTEEILLNARDSLSKIHSRRIHLINIFCRRLILNSKQDGPDEMDIAKDEYLKLWMELLVSTERQLRERLVAFSFTTVLRLASSTSTNTPTNRYWLPHGVAQMERWVAINNEQIQDHLKLLVSEAGKLGKRLRSISEYVPKEQCRFCPSSVPFESPEVASCAGSKNSNGVSECHKLSRCATSMQLCPITPLWFCVCCQRWIWKLPPQTLFTMSEYPSLNSLTESSALQVFSKPFCPFCGILLQRLQSEFLLFTSPV